MRYKNIIFDLDGTLLDTSEGIKDAVRFTIEKMGYRHLEDKEMDSFIGPPIQNSLINHFGCTTEEAQRGAGVFREYYKDVSLLKASPYKGIYELMEFIIKNDMNAAVATYKREDYALKLLNAYKFDDYCKVMHGADNFNKLTKSDIIKNCVDELCGKVEESLYVGDTNGDLKGSAECGMDFIGVTYGFGFKQENGYNFKTVDSCEELLEFLRSTI